MRASYKVGLRRRQIMADQGGIGGAPPPPPPPPGNEPSDQAGAFAPRGVGQILSSSFEVYRRYAPKLLQIVAIVVVPLTLLNALISNVVFAPETTLGVNPITGEPTEVVVRSTGVAIVVALIGVLVSIVITAMLQAAILRAAAQSTLGDPVDASESLRFGYRRVGSVILVSVLVGLVVGGGAIVLGLIGALLGPLVVIFVLAAVVWAVFAGTRLSVSVPALVVENARGAEALRRSWDLVGGHFWHVLATVVVATLIAGIVGGVISALGGGNWFLGWVFSAIGQIITAPFVALVTATLYLDLRARAGTLTADRLRTELSL
jgi:hypothetical protein